MNYLKLTVALALVFTRSAWSAEPAPKQVADDLMAVAKSNNEFATDLYAHLRSDKSTNLFFSPYSISTALAMTSAGAHGETEAQIAKVLHFTLPEAKLHPAFNQVRKILTDGDKALGFQVRVANRLWAQEGFHFQPDFLQVTNANYGAEPSLLDFKQSEAARKTINAWVDEQTDHKIQDLLAPGALNASTRLVLTNAIYFKAHWTHPFGLEDATTDAPFRTSASQQVTVPTMHQTEYFRYSASDNVQVLELPYGQSGSLSMLILLPTKIDGLSDLEKQLTSENLQKWSAGLQSRRVKVDLPKFKMTSEFSLGTVLESMGMPLAFSAKADFSRISTQEPLSISAVIHKAFVDVNENGTEAAAATGLMMALSVEPPPSAEFHADHPFVFLIRGNRTQNILFLGRLMNPKG
jgi:serpin B